jgi:predicted aspartyl protease
MTGHQKSSRTWGWVALILWAILIVAGIVMKRVYGLPDMMVFFHLPAAVFLVMAFRVLSRDLRARYQLGRQGRRLSRRFIPEDSTGSSG